MANLPEVSNFDSGVFQLETNTAAQGGSSGPMNNPLKNLANRTRYLKDVVDGLGSGKLDIRALPVGTTLEYSGSTLPIGFLWEDGSNISRTTYAALFTAIGTTYGAGNGSTTFTLPDSRGRVAVGRDNMGGTSAARLSGVIGSTTLGAVGGDQWLMSHSHGLNDPSHSHGVGDPGHAHSVSDPGHVHGMFTSFGTGGPNANARFYDCGIAAAIGGPKGTDGAGTGIGILGAGTGIFIGGAFTGQTVQAAGAGGSQNVQPCIVKNRIIFTGVFA